MKPSPAAMLSGRTLPDPCHAYLVVSSTLPWPRFLHMLSRSVLNIPSCRRFWMRRTCTMRCVSRDTRSFLPPPRFLS